ncbi:hypothetical protein B0H19DRAFT_1067876 [Mycena capillaripes]|nr:hypothetical protein B0H19DRAFT_1067876 [Mycena capillaripes]
MEGRPNAMQTHPQEDIARVFAVVWTLVDAGSGTRIVVAGVCLNTGLREGGEARAEVNAEKVTGEGGAVSGQQARKAGEESKGERLLMHGQTGKSICGLDWPRSQSSVAAIAQQLRYASRVVEAQAWIALRVVIDAARPRGAWKALPGDIRENPLILDENGHLVQPQHRRIIYGGPLSLIRQRSPQRAMPLSSVLSTCLARNNANTTRNASAGGHAANAQNRKRDGERVALSPCVRSATAGPSAAAVPADPPVPAAVAPVQHSIIRVGARRPQRPALTHERLWLIADRPPPLAEVKEHHKCIVCLSVKSHSVS